jgi:hypothetical protein
MPQREKPLKYSVSQRYRTRSYRNYARIQDTMLTTRRGPVRSQHCDQYSKARCTFECETLTTSIEIDVAEFLSSRNSLNRVYCTGHQATSPIYSLLGHSTIRFSRSKP